MAYNSAIPIVTDTGPQSAVDIRNNFQAIDTVNSVNHVDFNAGDQGKHKFLQMPEQAAAPATLANECALYSKVSPSSATAALFFRNESSGDEVEVTGATKAVDGWAYLPSGIIMKWGSGTVAAASPDTETFPVGAGIPVFTTVYNAQVSIAGGAADDGAIYVKLLTLLDITVQNSGTTGPRTYYYFVIGV